MSGFDSLADNLQGMGLGQHQFDHHELRIEYPVLELLPSEEAFMPSLRPPRNVISRKKPDISNHDSQPSSTDFKILLPLTNTITSSIPTSELSNVFAALVRISESPGQSLLQLLTFSDPEDGEVYRIRLLTEHNGDLRTVAESELSSIAWEAEYAACRSMGWVRVVDDLVNRATDRAYTHVHQRLRHYSWYQKQVRREQWDWEEMVLISVDGGMGGGIEEEERTVGGAVDLETMMDGVSLL